MLLILVNILLTIQIDAVPASHQDEQIFLTGNFNGWHPADSNYRLQKQDDGTWYLQVRLDDVPSDRLEYKFTRGSWSQSESTAEGRLTGPRIKALDSTIIENCTIEGWRDDFPLSTASPNVHLLDSAFYMPQLGKHRKIWVYLPESYKTSNRSYPVLYMHDGQHLFDEATSQGRIGPIEWGVDEYLDQLSESCIVIAINHPENFDEREQELFMYPNARYSDVHGAAYLDFIVETLKPHVDKHFRTKPEKEHSALLGSSLGGLISLYGGLRYPHIFGMVGVLSPSIWLDDGHILHYIRQSGDQSAIKDQHYFFYAGKEEFRRKPDGTFVHMHTDVQHVLATLEQYHPIDATLSIRPYGRHGALHWREAFPDFVNWFMTIQNNTE